LDGLAPLKKIWQDLAVLKHLMNKFDILICFDLATVAENSVSNHEWKPELSECCFDVIHREWKKKTAKHDKHWGPIQLI